MPSPPLFKLGHMRIKISHNYYPEDMVPYSVVRDHLRYDYGDAEELVKSYVASACDYMETLTNRVFSSTNPDRHETGEDTYNESPTAKKALVTVWLDRDEINKIQTLRNITGDFLTVSGMYYDNTGTWVELPTTDAQFDDIEFRLDSYPPQIDMTNFQAPEDLYDKRDYDLYRFTLTGGDNVKDLPRQYRQAMLLLVGHYDSQREAEYIGGLTTEIKEGVQRLLATVKVY